MFGLFGALALLVAAIGLYSVISYVIAQRAHEFGVRLALGSGTRRILVGVLADGVRIALAGCAIGLVLAAIASRWIEPLLFNESARDPVVYAGVGLALLGVAVLACVLPAARAAAVDPAAVLRDA
jgi:putative ABC transport system permease protein